MGLPAATYTTQLDTLKTSFPTTLETFRQSYIVHHAHPDSQESANIYAQNKGQITAANTALFTLKNTVQSETDTINGLINTLVTTLQTEKISYTTLLDKISQKKGKERSAYNLIHESKESYKYQYMKNVTIIAGDLLLIYLIYRLYKK
jgi:uncharacterized protein YdiU (UPF0061 family)